MYFCDMPSLFSLLLLLYTIVLQYYLGHSCHTNVHHELEANTYICVYNYIHIKKHLDESMYMFISNLLDTGVVKYGAAIPSSEMGGVIIHVIFPTSSMAMWLFETTTSTSATDP